MVDLSRPRAMAQAAEEKGPFVLFTLFLHEGAADRWDFLLVAGPWAGDDGQGVVEYFVDQVKSRLGAQVLMNLSRIIVIDPEHPDVQALNRAIQVEHGRVELRDTDFSGQTIKRGYIVTAQRLQAPAPA